MPNNFEYEIYSNHERFINMTDEEFRTISKKDKIKYNAEYQVEDLIPSTTE